MSKVKEQAAAHKAMKEEVLAEVQKQRRKALIPRDRVGAPSYVENQAAIKEAIEKPINHKKQALKLFDQVISANADKVFKKLLQKASDDDDKDQMAALKLIADRLAPLTSFTESGANGSNSGKVVINIAGLNNSSDVSVQGRVIDAEDVDVG
jgi:hypothetical protein